MKSLISKHTIVIGLPCKRITTTKLQLCCIEVPQIAGVLLHVVGTIRVHKNQANTMLGTASITLLAAWIRLDDGKPYIMVLKM